MLTIMSKIPLLLLIYCLESILTITPITWYTQYWFPSGNRKHLMDAHNVIY